jgi:recombinase-like zinc beta ribbon protein
MPAPSPVRAVRFATDRWHRPRRTRAWVPGGRDYSHSASVQGPTVITIHARKSSTRPGTSPNHTQTRMSHPTPEWTPHDMISAFDVWRPGKHEPMISADLWQTFKCKRLASAGMPARHRIAVHALSGLLVCGQCGGSMVAHHRGGMRSHRWICFRARDSRGRSAATLQHRGTTARSAGTSGPLPRSRPAGPKSREGRPGGDTAERR